MRRALFSFLPGLICAFVVLTNLVSADVVRADFCPGGPINTAPPVTTANTHVVGDVLTVITPGNWMDNPATGCGPINPATRTYQWVRNGVVIPGATGTSYTVTADDVGIVNPGIQVVERLCDVFAFCSTKLSVTYARIPVPPSPKLVSPRSGELFRDALPANFILTVSNPNGCNVIFRIGSEPTLGVTATDHPGDNATTYTYLAPSSSGAVVYFWSARFTGGAVGSACNSGYAPASSFTDEHEPLGVYADEPFLSAAGVSVNEATGNLVASAPAPSYTSISGSLAAAVTYNSHDPASTDNQPLGAGWSVGIGDSGASVPLRLVNHDPTYDAIEVVYAGGGSRWFAHIVNPSDGTDRYEAPAGETARLVRDVGTGTPPNLTYTFTLSDDDGSIVTFVESDQLKTYRPETAVLPVSKGSNARLTYTFYGGNASTLPLISSISDPASPGRALTFRWAAQGAYTGLCNTASADPVRLCITGPDPNVAYRYLSKSSWTSTPPHLYRVTRLDSSTGTPKERVLIEYGYDAFPATGAGLLQSIRSANDVNSPNDPNAPRSSAFAWNAAHGVAISYDAMSPARVTQVSETPITTDSGTQTQTWSLGYSCGALTVDGPSNTHTQPSLIDRPASGTTAFGCATVRGPNQQPSGAQESVQFDRLYHPLEQIDELGRKALMQYDERNLLLWTEDGYGYPTDNTYDPATHVLATTVAPGPDPANVQVNRPTTRYAYDEAVRDPDGAGAALATSLYGLQAAFFPNATLSGVPSEQRTEAKSGAALLDATWDSSHLFGPSSAILPGGIYSVRWRGYLQIDTAGDYGFHIRGDGNVRLWIDKTLAIDSWDSTPPNDVNRELPKPDDAHALAEVYPLTQAPVQGLTVGRHSITLEYAHTGSTGQTHLLWTTPTQPNLSPIPLDHATPAWLNQTSTTTPQGLVSSSHYDEPWRGLADYTTTVSKDTSAGPAIDHITTMHYDDYGRVTSKTLPNGNVPTGIPGVACTIDSSTGALSGSNCNAPAFTTTYTYWAPGDLLANPGPTPPSGCSAPGGSLADSTGQLRRVQQNAAGTPAPAATKTWYDASGRPVLEERGAGVWCMQYNDEGRLSVQYAPGEVTVGSTSAPQRRTFTYDPAGALRTVTGGDSKQATASTLTFDYDEAGRLRKATNALTEQSQYGYDADSNITTRRVYTGGFPVGTNYTTTYLYDAADQLTQQTDPAARIYKFGYDSRGQLVWTWYPNTTLSWNRVNPTGWTLNTYSRPCPAPTGTCGGLATAPVTPSSNPPGTATADFADWTYTRDQDGSITGETRTGTGLTSTSNAYTYDAAGRLITATTSGGASASRTWGYDLDSNRISDTLGATTTTYTYTPPNPADTAGWPDALFSTTTGATKTCYVYDTDGRQISKRTYSGTGACTSTASRFATWDGRDRINGFSATSASGPFSGPQKYDPLDRTQRRLGVAAANDRWYLYAGMEGAPTFEKSVSSGAVTRTHIPGPAGDLAEYAGVPTTASTVTYHYYNAHGDLAASATQAGARVNTYANEPFGKPTQYQTGAGKDETPASDTALERYTGRWDKRYDTSWNIIEMGARPYDPIVGKFLSVDPVDGGSANNYDYAYQDPVNGQDLSGQGAFPMGGCPVACQPMNIPITRDDIMTALLITQIALTLVDGGGLGVGGSMSREAVAARAGVPVPPRGPGTEPVEARATPRFHTRAMRDEISNRQGGRCAGCGKKGPMQYHHNTRHSDGGGTSAAEGTGLCYACHKSLHGRG